MTTSTAIDSSLPEPSPPGSDAPTNNRRASWLPNGAMILTRFMELRKRRGLMIALVVVTIGIPAIFLTVRLVAHVVAPHSYGPAGGYDVFSALVAGVLYVFGFIVAATLGCTAGSVDLTEGMFRHLVVTGRSRLALYLARIPAGLAIIVPLVAAGFTIVCVVCVFAAPSQLKYDGVNVPANLSRAGLESWAADHADEVICNFNLRITQPSSHASLIPSVINTVGCARISGGGVGIIKQGSGPPGQSKATPTQIRAVAVLIAHGDYSDYARRFLYPSNSLMIKTGLWIELEAIVGFIVGLGLGSLLGQRTVAVVLMLVLEIVLTPILSSAHIPHMINLQRAVVGLAVAHLQPSGLAFVFGGGGGPSGSNATSLLVPESTAVAICVIVAWLVGWTVLGAWRMVKRDA